MVVSRPHNRLGVSTTAKHSILHDIDNTIMRVNAVLKGERKFLDCNTKSGLIALKHLRDAHAALTVGLIPTNDE